MKTADTDIVMFPGWMGAGPDHWLSRWQAKLKTARWVRHENWSSRDPEDWFQSVAGAVNGGSHPIVLVAHALGAASIVQAAPRFNNKVAGAFLVAPPDLSPSNESMNDLVPFGRYSNDPLPFPSTLVASRNDPHCSYERSQEMAADWGSHLVDAGSSGHLDTESGHGPWPEGLMVFAGFMAKLSPSR